MYMTIELVTNMFGIEDRSLICVPKEQIQTGDADCGLFAITCMTGLAHWSDLFVINYVQRKMRAHLMECFGIGRLVSFPTSD